MKIKNPLMSIDARGRYALALVYSIWRGLNYARAFVVPTNPQSGRQLTVRGFLTTAVRAWADLTQDQRDNWNDESKDVKTTDVFGDNVIISGINYYTALSTIAQDLGETPVSDPPTAKPPKNVDTVAIATGALSGEVLVTWDGASEGDFVDVWITGALGPGRTAQKSDYSHHSFTAIATATLTIDGLIPDAFYGVKVRAVFNSGQVSGFESGRAQAKT
jgi:hypothetical protein